MMNKCKTCSFKNLCAADPENCTYGKPPTRFEQFRLQTATIDGLVEWCVVNGNCLSCNFTKSCPLAEEEYEMTSEQQDEYCKQGIKAYFKGLAI
jgi:hypothetical protein